MPVTSIQRALGHARLRSTETYIDMPGLQVQADYEAAMAQISERLGQPRGTLMSPREGRRRPNLRHELQVDPTLRPIAQRPPANRGFDADFRKWLRERGCTPSALNIYSVAARLALGLPDSPNWAIDPAGDPGRVRQYIAHRYTSEGTRTS